MKSKYLDPLRVMIGIGRREEALRARKVKRKRFAEAKVFLTHTNFGSRRALNTST